ncbi:MAG: xanthine dehydrogenase accessory protein XdhC [Pseudomonadota bacterium]
MTDGLDLSALTGALDRADRVARILVLDDKGSAPRGAGTSMLVWADGQAGTIGGGALEFEATARARSLLAEDAAPWQRERMSMPLGPALGQCCGGAVSLLIELFGVAERGWFDVLTGAQPFTRPVAPGIPPIAGHRGDLSAARAPFWVTRTLQAQREGAPAPRMRHREGWIVEPVGQVARPLWLYGAGHVGRAVVRVFEDLPFTLTWVDTAEARFPDPLPHHTTARIAANPADLVADAPGEALHIVMTYSHALDLEICHRVLSRDFAHLGLIGSETKAARFRKRLRALGHPEERVAALVCPIGDRSLGKEPAAIAIGLAAECMRHATASGGAAVQEAGG